MRFVFSLLFFVLIVLFSLEGHASYLPTQSGANVGIGTFSTAALLDVSSTASQDLFRVNDNGAGDTTPFIIDSVGNVGIGTFTLDEKLTIRGHNTYAFDGYPVPGTTLGQIHLVNSSSLDGDSTAITFSAHGSGQVAQAGIYAQSHGSYGTKLHFATTPNFGVGALYAMTIDHSGRVGIKLSNPDGGALIVNTTDGNVGINTIRPGTALDVGGTVRATAFSGDGSALTNVANSAGFTDGGTIVHLTTSTDNLGIGTTDASQAKLMVVGNVGIGTINFTPSAVVHIQQPANADAFRVDDQDGTDTSPFIITSSGGVGIGTTVSLSGLTIGSYGGITTHGGGSTYFNLVLGSIHTFSSFSGSSATSGSMYNFGSGNAYTSVANNPFFVINTDASQPGPIFEVAKETNRYFTVGASGNVGVGTFVGNAFLDISSTAAQDLFRVNDNGTGDVTPALFVDSAGNVGIGTLQTDGNLLTIPFSITSGTQSSSYNQVYFANAGTDATLYLQNSIFRIMHPTNGVNALTFDMNSGNVGLGTVTARAIFDITSTASQDLFKVHDNGDGDTTPFVVNSEGNVGIGSTVPGSQFDVVGVAPGTANIVRFFKSGQSAGVGLAADNVLGGSNSDVILRPILSIAGQSGGVTFRVNNAGSESTAVGINIDGNMGIATINPVAKLEITQTSTVDAFRVNDQSVDTTPFIINSVGNVGIGTFVANRALEVMGNVGIGTTADAYTLRVNNTIVTYKEYDNGGKSGAFTVDWNLGNKQKVTITGTNLDITFTNPTSGVGNFLLKVIQGDGSDTIDWANETDIKWPSGTPPTLSTAASAIDIVSCYFDGTNYFCAANLDFQ